MTTWLGVGDDDPFGPDNLPYGAAQTERGRRVMVRIGDLALDLTRATSDGEHGSLFASGTLDSLLAAGRETWSAVRRTVTDWLTRSEHRARIESLLTPIADLDMVLPFAVADYVDFYASEHHASTVGALFRPGGPALPANWKHLPIGYHGRAGTVIVSGTDVMRPRGQYRQRDGSVGFGPSHRLDLEAEVGFVVGAPSPSGKPVPAARFADHVFGVCLVNDWSARDIQSWEYVPLGPFLGKSFATSMSAWITPLDALAHAWVPAPPQDPRPLPYLEDDSPAGALALDLEVRLNGTVVARPPFARMYWTPAQLLAHLTVNGARLRTGDLLASGTVSGPGPGERGCLLELTSDGREPVRLADGSHREYLQDGDEVVVTATAPGAHGGLSLGEVRGRVVGPG